MKRKTLMMTATGVALLAAAAGNVLAQQVYKWKDAKGVTHYSDTPPPGSQSKVQVKQFNAAGGSVDMPFALAAAVRGAPVTLYTTINCNACDAARAALVARGVPYSEKTVTTSADHDQLKQAGGSDQLPFILVGRTRLTGFDPDSLSAALNAARYPAERVVGPGFRLATVTSAAVPPPAPAVAAQPKQEEQAPPVPPAPAVQF